MPVLGLARVYLTLPTLWGRVRLSIFNDFGFRPAKSPRFPERGLFRFRSQKGLRKGHGCLRHSSSPQSDQFAA